MTVIKCDSCGEELQTAINFRIDHCSKIAGSTYREADIKRTPFLDYCEDCFSELLEKLGIEEE